MMTWPYLCDETSSKTTVTNCPKKCHHCTQIWHMGSYSRCNHSNPSLTHHSNHSLTHHSNHSLTHHSNHSLTHHSNHLHLAQKYKVPFARFARFRGLIKDFSKYCNNVLFVFHSHPFLVGNPPISGREQDSQIWKGLWRAAGKNNNRPISISIPYHTI